MNFPNFLALLIKTSKKLGTQDLDIEDLIHLQYVRSFKVIDGH